MTNPAILALADGSIFRGEAIGADGATSGEVVFNTAMTGYQEILTDPSYTRQMVTLTYPHIGNTGTNPEDMESDRVRAAGLIIRDLPLLASNWRHNESLPEYLRRENVVAIAGVDTRRLTRLLRDQGALGGAIVAGANATEEQALRLARDFPGIKGMDLASEAGCREARTWTQSAWTLDEGYGEGPEKRYRVVAYDYGIKYNILRLLVSRGCDVTLVPARTPLDEVMAYEPDGVFFSNGPGDPEPCDYAIEALKGCIERQIPTFGICLGHQLLGLAVGGRSEKMKFGHHGANHPVERVTDGTVVITSQNHGFAVDETSLPDNVEVTHRSLFDGTLQGMRLRDAPVFSFQGHPEASPGPRDVIPLFDAFTRLMDDHQHSGSTRTG
ncbi:glutamine-hydrolyzing carbamoyl-phosphate synthase small subunit [Halomonadaceae bacterium KBTZ08]